MRIAQVAANVEPVPPRGYGGTELVVSLLTDELVRRGHEVTLFATGDSSTKANLVTVTKEALRAAGKYPPTQWSAFDMETLLLVKDMQEQFDVVHNHMSWTALPYLEMLNCAVLTTMHNQVKPYCAPLYTRYKDLPYVAISNSFRKLNMPDELNYAATIYNGIRVRDFTPPELDNNRDYLLFVGRICKDKGTAEAIDVALKLNLPIKIAGKVDKNDEIYFEEEVKPRLSKKAEFIGEVGHEQKVSLYRQAIAVVYPITFNEPFGLVMAESLAAGTPVMAFDKGSVREVLDDKTSIIGKSVDDLVNGFSKVEMINREDCISRVQSLFSVEKMVDSYEKLYEQLIKNKRQPVRAGTETRVSER